MLFGLFAEIAKKKQKGNKRLPIPLFPFLTCQFDLRRCRIASGNRRQDWLQRFG
jgi:hypothetical protein